MKKSLKKPKKEFKIYEEWNMSKKRYDKIIKECEHIAIDTDFKYNKDFIKLIKNLFESPLDRVKVYHFFLQALKKGRLIGERVFRERK